MKLVLSLGIEYYTRDEMMITEGVALDHLACYQLRIMAPEAGAQGEETGTCGLYLLYHSG